MSDTKNSIENSFSDNSESGSNETDNDICPTETEIVNDVLPRKEENPLTLNLGELINKREDKEKSSKGIKKGDTGSKKTEKNHSNNRSQSLSKLKKLNPKTHKSAETTEPKDNNIKETNDKKSTRGSLALRALISPRQRKRSSSATTLSSKQANTKKIIQEKNQRKSLPTNPTATGTFLQEERPHPSTSSLKTASGSPSACFNPPRQFKTLKQTSVDQSDPTSPDSSLLKPHPRRRRRKSKSKISISDNASASESLSDSSSSPSISSSVSSSLWTTSTQMKTEKPREHLATGLKHANEAIASARFTATQSRSAAHKLSWAAEELAGVSKNISKALEEGSAYRPLTAEELKQNLPLPSFPTNTNTPVHDPWCEKDRTEKKIFNDSERLIRSVQASLSERLDTIPPDCQDKRLAIQLGNRTPSRSLKQNDDANFELGEIMIKTFLDISSDNSESKRVDENVQSFIDYSPEELLSYLTSDDEDDDINRRDITQNVDNNRKNNNEDSVDNRLVTMNNDTNNIGSDYSNSGEDGNYNKDNEDNGDYSEDDDNGYGINNNDINNCASSCVYEKNSKFDNNTKQNRIYDVDDDGQWQMRAPQEKSEFINQSDKHSDFNRQHGASSSETCNLLEEYEILQTMTDIAKFQIKQSQTLKVMDKHISNQLSELQTSLVEVQSCRFRSRDVRKQYKKIFSQIKTLSAFQKAINQELSIDLQSGIKRFVNPFFESMLKLLHIINTKVTQTNENYLEYYQKDIAALRQALREQQLCYQKLENSLLKQHALQVELYENKIQILQAQIKESNRQSTIVKERGLEYIKNQHATNKRLQAQLRSQTQTNNLFK